MYRLMRRHDTSGLDTHELGLFTPVADAWRPLVHFFVPGEACTMHSKDGAVGRRILAGTVSDARARVGLGLCIRVDE
jgi:hypothetical protein